MPDNPDRSWEFYGKNDPYYGVLTLSKYRQSNLSEAAREEFWATGQIHVEQIFQTIQNHLEPAFSPKRVLDFGCGVGRLTMPLAARCDTVVGVDISPSMLQEAQNNCQRKGLSNIKWLEADDRLSKVTGTFDLINSHIVFQHIPRKRGEKIFERLIDLLADGGIGALHFTYFRQGPAIGWIDWARKTLPFVNGIVNITFLKLPFAYPMVQMNKYDLGRLFRILQEKQCDRPFVTFSYYSLANVSTYGMTIFFQKNLSTNDINRDSTFEEAK